LHIDDKINWMTWCKLAKNEYNVNYGRVKERNAETSIYTSVNFILAKKFEYNFNKS